MREVCSLLWQVNSLLHMLQEEKCFSGFVFLHAAMETSKANQLYYLTRILLCFYKQSASSTAAQWCRFWVPPPPPANVPSPPAPQAIKVRTPLRRVSRPRPTAATRQHSFAAACF